MIEYIDIDKLSKCKITYNKISSELKRIMNKSLWGFRDYRQFEEDLLSEGFIELYKAYKRFDITRGARFATYAYFRLQSRFIRFYLSLKYPYGGIKSLSGKCNNDIKDFFNLNTSLPSISLSLEDSLEVPCEDDLYILPEELKREIADFIESGKRSNKKLKTLVKEVI